MERRSAKIHSVITSIKAVSPPIDENGDPSGVWAMPEEGDDMSCMHDGPLVGNLSFPGHVMAFIANDGRARVVHRPPAQESSGDGRLYRVHGSRFYTSLDWP